MKAKTQIFLPEFFKMTIEELQKLNRQVAELRKDFSGLGITEKKNRKDNADAKQDKKGKEGNAEDGQKGVEAEGV